MFRAEVTLLGRYAIECSKHGPLAQPTIAVLAKHVFAHPQGITGYTGNGGWYVEYNEGVPQRLDLAITLLPPGQHILFSTRYPEGTKFKIQRVFKWYSALTQDLTPVATKREVLLGDGVQYNFDGHHLTLKLVDPGTNTPDSTLSR